MANDHIRLNHNTPSLDRHPYILELTPRDWQVDCAEAFNLGIDCTVIAGTGSGKTLPFVMPALLHGRGKVTLVLSPLNSLEEDQVRRFREMGLEAAAVNGETWDSQLHQDLLDMKYQVILTSPEMVLGHLDFIRVLSSAAYQSSMIGVVVDEAHCIEQWGGDFRPAYGNLSKIRALIPLHVPVYATSATMSSSVLAEIRRVLHIDPKHSSSSHFESLDFVFEGAERVEDITFFRKASRTLLTT